MGILFLDIETTGLDKKKNGVIEIAAEYHEDRKMLRNFCVKLCPKDSLIDMGALKINRQSYYGIKNLVKEESGVEDFVDFILSLPLDRTITPCGCNVGSFDIAFLKELLEKYNVVGLESILSYKVRDISTWARELIEDGLIDLTGIKVRGTLEKLAEYFDIKYDKNILHTASGDVELSAKVYYKLKDLHKEVIDCYKKSKTSKKNEG